MTDDLPNAVRLFGARELKLAPLGEDAAKVEEATWVDLLRPNAETEARFESLLGIDIPTEAEMREIEISSRLYTEGEAAFMTAWVMSRADGDDVRISPVTFILAGNRLITVRYEEPRVFTQFAERGQRALIGCSDAESILVGLLEAIVNRLADVLERATQELDALSQNVFRPESAPARDEKQAKKRHRRPRTSQDYQSLLEAIGRKYDLTSKIRDSLLSLERLSSFLLHVAQARAANKEIGARVRTLSRDANALSEHVDSVSQKITFLLDATLGMVNIEQNTIIKIFSVAAVVFLPPTLIASIYGMNFEHMPELDWLAGYPLAVGLMILSAILPYLFFKGRGWL